MIATFTFKRGIKQRHTKEWAQAATQWHTMETKMQNKEKNSLKETIDENKATEKL